MNIKVNDVLSHVVSNLTEVVATEMTKGNVSGDHTDTLKVTSMLIDLRFQIDFTLMWSVKEVQDLYDKYRNRPAEESNIEIRTLFDLASSINIFVNDTYKDGTSPQPWVGLIDRLSDLITLHSEVNPQHTTQDESITQGMDASTWKTLLKANPWLVAAVCIRLIPGYYMLDITSTESTSVTSGGKYET